MIEKIVKNELASDGSRIETIQRAYTVGDDYVEIGSLMNQIETEKAVASINPHDESAQKRIADLEKKLSEIQKIMDLRNKQK